MGFQFIGKAGSGIVRRESNRVTLELCSLCLLLLSCSPTRESTKQEPPVEPKALTGVVDLHTHPMSNLGFAGKLLYGGVDLGSLLPADPDCQEGVRAETVLQALGHDRCTHGAYSLLNNCCGDSWRSLFVTGFQKMNNASIPPGDAQGMPNFTDWPKWNDITHQKMWVDWIRRAYYYGDLRVIVALAVNNRTTAESVKGFRDGPVDDMESADLQIDELIKFVARHDDFMEIAYSSSDLARIVGGKTKLAVVLGVEIDKIGNLEPNAKLTHSDIAAAVDHLYCKGVRYVLPIHLIDNVFGGTAVYEDIFNMSNLRENNKYYDLACSADAGVETVTYAYNLKNAWEACHNPSCDVSKIARTTDQSAAISSLSTCDDDGWWNACRLAIFEVIKLGMGHLVEQEPILPQDCRGMVNRLGLTDDGAFAIEEMMRRGMLIDIDHMSEAARRQVIQIAQTVPNPGSRGGFGYPLNSGHNWLRGFLPDGVDAGVVTEKSLTASEYAQIAALNGMAGVFTAGLTATQWLQMYSGIQQAMGRDAGLAFGTDTNGFVVGMPPPAEGTSAGIEYTSAFPASWLGNKTWNYNDAGVAHYGMMADLMYDMRRNYKNGPAIIDGLRQGANHFYETWRLCEAFSAAGGEVPGFVPPFPAPAPPALCY